ncbi:DUF2577 domain-containing protein [Paenibacillus sp. 1011MAR3C5]|uniref:DUF2577 domain-containing protein n=1 Tax=Paenibacillus sp. 1011MAR3C5 TaxID=1675787 RepID=UPI000E6C4CE0|nr:DUF2577 domain-containing protein [Paenibacillus sp. 1011MAR3C5]RJE84271.1 DUF2577 domain-containing protein [Paenibacillus sp. 1011MAR3C5]
MSMLELIKKAGAGAVEASNPVNILYGEIVSVHPLSVRVDQRFTLPAGFLILTESLALRGLEQGDRVLLLRMQGGQRYVVLDRTVSA